jgi:hypothetical protein
VLALNIIGETSIIARSAKLTSLSLSSPKYDKNIGEVTDSAIYKFKSFVLYDKIRNNFKRLSLLV